MGGSQKITLQMKEWIMIFLIGKRKSRERCSEVFCVQELFSFNIGVMF